MIINTTEEFYTFFEIGRPILGIDYGEKKIGLALSTPDHQMSLPLKLLTGDSEKKKLNKIAEISKEKNACGIVIGMPLNMDGTKSTQTLIVEKFTEKLVKRTNIPIFFQDERLTSRAADNFLKSFGIKRKNRNESDDLTAASMILETTLKSKHNMNNAD